jgi:DNA-binding response OmpR family regulator
VLEHLSAHTVLLLEDEPFIALDIEEVLTKAGFEVVQTISSCCDAEAWLEEHTPDLAVIDPQLRDGFCSNVAQILVERKIPFVVHSGEPVDSEVGALFLSGEWLSKPCQPSALLSAIRNSMAGEEV